MADANEPKLRERCGTPKSTLALVIDGSLRGMLLLADPLKPDAAAAVVGVGADERVGSVAEGEDRVGDRDGRRPPAIPAPRADQRPPRCARAREGGTLRLAWCSSG